MRRLALVLALIAVPVLALANAARRAVPTERVLFVGTRGSAIAAGSPFGHVVVSRQTTVTAVSVWVSTGGGGGAGTSVFRITDGTRNCDATLTCAASASPNWLKTGDSGFTLSGTCTFPAGAKIYGTVQATTCTTTQPSVVTLDAYEQS